MMIGHFILTDSAARLTEIAALYAIIFVAITSIGDGGRQNLQGCPGLIWRPKKYR